MASRRFLTSIITVAAAVALSVPARADEGMWLLPLLDRMNGDMICKLGGHLTPEQIYSINNSSIKDAIVQFGGGCTGEIISDNGLLVTNHHCGYSSIQSLSTPEHNYLEDGYFAKSRSEEIPVPGLTVRFLQSMKDVTEEMNAGQAEDVEKARAAIIRKAGEENPDCEIQVVSFYNSNVWYMIVSKVYRDVRFVGAPPASSGKFGGDTDNWMWPRHTCDFSMFRVYADTDNRPADYAESNVPMTPRQSLRISLRGYEEGDFAMIMGYPGRTQRFQTAAQLEDMLTLNDIRIAARTVRQDIMWEARMADPVVNLQYASKYASSSNGWKKWQGMKAAFAKLDIIGREQKKEAEFKEWVSARKKRVEAYGGALDEIEAGVKAASEPQKSYTLLSETLYRIELQGFASALFRSPSLEDGKKALEASYRDYNEALDRKEAAALIRFYLDNVLPGEEVVIEGHDLRDTDAYVDYLFSSSAFSSKERMSGINSKEEIKDDPAYRFNRAVIHRMLEFREAAMKGQESIDSGSRAFTAGLLQWKKGEPSYPDANSTCRLTFGTVKGYSPRDGVIYRHYTTLKGVMEKEDPDNYEFRVPARLKEIYNTGGYGRYADRNGELVTCFLTNLDITGGNSGSPVLDADGCLIGLAFDGNWEAMSSDVMFEPDLQRCICVDIRYVLLMMDKFGGAGYLLDEMTLVE